jgi:hypothetical protein
MRTKKLVLLAVTMILTACGEPQGPLLEEAPAAQTRTSLTLLKWDQSGGPIHFGAEAISKNGALPLGPTVQASFTGDTVMATGGWYSTSFWAVRGETRELRVNVFRDNQAVPFLDLEISDPVTLPDGTPLAVGDSVLITVNVDTEELLADLQPSGLQFGAAQPTVLTMWYVAANDDLNSDAVVNSGDEAVQEQLDLWVQEHSEDPWTSLGAVHYIDNEKLVQYLQHFSGYAISW